jgi:hypothetical protein
MKRHLGELTIYFYSGLVTPAQDMHDLRWDVNGKYAQLLHTEADALTFRVGFATDLVDFTS